VLLSSRCRHYVRAFRPRRALHRVQDGAEVKVSFAQI
jgi:hypothetical protein